MHKIQILFPEPQMRRLRETARREDRAISEIVRRAIEHWLDRQASEHRPAAKLSVPGFHGGRTHIGAESMREAAWQDRTARLRRDGTPC